MPLEAQVSLLRLLQNGEVTRVGGKHTRLVNVRVLAATNRNLENAIRQNAFREDLYYRLNVFTLNVPPLRERSSDIALLINHFLDHFVASLGRGPLRVTDRAMDVLLGYPWPGNIRELENVIERMVHMSQGIPTIDIDVLPANILNHEGIPGVVPRSRRPSGASLASGEGDHRPGASGGRRQHPGDREGPRHFSERPVRQDAPFRPVAGRVSVGFREGMGN